MRAARVIHIWGLDMTKRIPLSLLMLLSAGSLYLGTAPGEAFAQDHSNSLAPIVYIGIDTSGSMNGSFGGDSNSRWTMAIQQLTGKALGSSSNTAYTNTRYPRKLLMCSDGLCDYKTIWICGTQFQKDHSKDTNLKDCINISGNSNRALKDFTPTTVSAFNSKNYLNNGVLHEYLNVAKFGFAGMAGYEAGNTTVDVPRKYEVTVGKTTVNDDSKASYGSTYTKGKSYYGVYNINITNKAPTLYPTPSDDPIMIRKSNDMIIQNVRSFSYGSHNTPLEPMIYSLYQMLNPDHRDLGLKQQPKPGATYTGSFPSAGDKSDKYWVVDSDHDYKCRKKAILAMTDGAPNVWNDDNNKIEILNIAKQAYESGIEIYPILYAQSESDVSRSAAKKPGTYMVNVTSMDAVMNNLAWKAGTCRTEGHKGDPILPDDEAAYKTYLAGYAAGTYTPCYWNAANGDALTNAVKAIMNQILAGYKSKSRMVLTTHVGSETVKNSAGDPTNGWYNIYTGYKIEFGNLSTTGLRREAYTCKTSGFEHDPSLSKNMALDYAKRFAECRAKTKIHASEYPNSGSADGTCKAKHLILVGDYSDSNRFSVGKNVKMIPITHNHAGVVKYKTNNVYSEYRFFDYEQSEKDSGAFSATLNDTIGVYANDNISQYMISPYECSIDSDCIPQQVEDTNSYICDMGKCIVRDNELRSCATLNCEKGQYCIKGQCRNAEGSECSNHKKCVEDNKVCHAGKCVTGVLTNGDIRDLIASLPLGTIEFGAPTVVPPPKLSYRNDGYTAFKGKYGDRDTMLYAPANDGMLHAFVLGKNNKDKNYSTISGIKNSGFSASGALDTEGQEVWAFMPKGVMRDIHTLKNLTPENKLNVSPVYADLVFGVDKNGVNDWHSVLVGGFGNNGRGYYALDVTDPENPQILWEIDHQWQVSGDKYPVVDIHGKTSASSENDDAPFSRLGYSRPAVALTNIWLDGTLTPVAILSGGFPVGENSNETDIEGKAVYIVKLNPANKEDLLVAKFKFDTPITGTPAVFPTGFNSSAEVIYVGDEKGALHRIDISHKSIINKNGQDKCEKDQKDCWTLNGQELKRSGSGNKTFSVSDNTIYPIFDPNRISALNPNGNGSYGRITYKPALNAVGSTGKDIQIAYGSGDNTESKIETSELNYAAVFIDHYVNDEIGYKLNNFNANKKASSSKDAYTQKIKPVVIVFNPITGIHSDDARSRETYGEVNDRQYFEIIAGQLTNSELQDPDPVPEDKPECDAACKYIPSEGICAIDNVSYKDEKSSCFTTIEQKECVQSNDEGLFDFCASWCKYGNSWWTGKAGCHDDTGAFGAIACSGCETPTISSEPTCNVEKTAGAIQQALFFMAGGWMHWIVTGESPKQVIEKLINGCKDYKYMVNGSCFKTQVHDYDASKCDKPTCCDDGKAKSRARTGAARSGGDSNSKPNSNDISSRQKMFGPAITYNYRTYFPTFNSIDPASESCSEGYASIWLVNALTDENLRWGSGVTTKSKNQANYASLTGATDEGKPASALDGSKRVSFVNLQNGTIVYELMFTPQMSCINGNKVSYVSPMLVAQTGGAAGVSGSHTANDDIFGDGSSSSGIVDQNINILSITEQMLGSVSMPSSWGSVYE